MSWYCEEDLNLQRTIDGIKIEMEKALKQIEICEETEESEWSTKRLKRDVENFLEDWCR